MTKEETKINDRDFFDLLYSQWAKTTGAEDTFWMSEHKDDIPGGGAWRICSVDKEQKQKLVGRFSSEADADFIAAVHGCLPDLVRRLHAALDEGDRLDKERDDQEVGLSELNCEVAHWHDLWVQECEHSELLQENLNSAEERALEANAYADGVAEENRRLERELSAAYREN